MSEGTGNDANDNALERAEISSIPDSLLSSPDANLIATSTVDDDGKGDDAKGKDGLGAGDDQLKGQQDGDGAGKDTTDKGQDARYDKDPAWQRILNERNEEREKRIAAEAKLEVLTKGETKPPEKEPEKLPFQDILGMEPDAVRELMEDDPLGFVKNLVEMTAHVTRQQIGQETAQKSMEQRIDETYSKYEQENPDFRQMWDSGELKKWMDAHPGTGAIAAHLTLTMEKKIAAAAEKAAKEAEEKTLANVKAKRNAQVLSEGPAHRGGKEVPAELSNTKQHGGLTAVIAKRLTAMRSGAQA